MSKNNQDNFPCIDCIIFPICKAQFVSANSYKGPLNENKIPIMITFYHSVYYKCSLVQSYLQNNGRIDTKKQVKQTYINRE